MLHPVQAVHQRAMLDHDSLGFAGRTGSIDNIGEIAGLIDIDRIFLRTAINSSIIQIDDRSIECCLADRLSVHQQYSDPCVLQHEVGASAWVIGGQRQVSGSGLDDPHNADHHGERPFHH